MLLSWPEIWTKQVQEDTYGIIYHTVQQVLVMKKSVWDKRYIKNSMIYKVITTQTGRIALIKLECMCALTNMINTYVCMHAFSNVTWVTNSLQ